jgi:hypothetical protein
MITPIDTSAVGFNDPANAVAGMTNVLMKAAEQRRLEQQQASEMLMRQQEFQQKQAMLHQQQEEHQRQIRAAAIEEIIPHLKSGDTEMARLTAQKYGIPLDEIAPAAAGAQGGSPGMVPGGPGMAGPVPSIPAPPPVQAFTPPGPQDQGPQGPQPSLGIPALRNPAAPPEQTGMNPVDNTVRVREPITINAGPDNPDQEHMDYAHQLLTHDNAVSADMDKVRQFQQAEQAVKSGAVPPAPSPSYRLGFPGNPLTVDVGKLKAAEETDKAERISKYEHALAGNEDAQKMARWMVTMEQPDANIAKALVESGKIDQRYENRLKVVEEQITGRKDVAGMNIESRKAIENQQEAAGKYGGNGQGGLNPLKQDMINNRAYKGAMTDTNTWSMRSGLDQLRKTMAGLDEVRQQAASGNAPSAAAALEKLTALSRSGSGAGAAATNAALALMQKHLSGTYGSVEGYIERVKSGDFGPEQKKNLIDAVNVMERGLKGSANQLHQQYVRGFYTPSRSVQKSIIEDQEETFWYLWDASAV